MFKHVQRHSNLFLPMTSHHPIIQGRCFLECQALAACHIARRWAAACSVYQTLSQNEPFKWTTWTSLDIASAKTSFWGSWWIDGSIASYLMSWGESTANSANAIAVQVPPKWVRGEKDSPVFQGCHSLSSSNLVKDLQSRSPGDDQTMNGW